MSVLIILILCGVLTSILSAVFGVGGAIIVVPVLRQLFPDVPIQSIAATSLMVVMLGALVNIVLFRRLKYDIDLKKLIIWSMAMLVGVQAGFFLSFLLPDNIIMVSFAITLLILALKSMLTKEPLQPQNNKSDTLLGAILSMIGGMVAGVTGLGGGSVLAPLMSQLPNVGHKRVAIYTNWMMFIGGVGSIWSYLTLAMPGAINVMAKWQIGYVNFYVVSIIFISSLVMSRFSMQLRGMMSARLTRILFSLLLVIIALFIFFTLK